jgi:hypothetical protein
LGDPAVGLALCVLVAVAVAPGVLVPTAVAVGVGNAVAVGQICAVGVGGAGGAVGIGGGGGAVTMLTGCFSTAVAVGARVGVGSGVRVGVSARVAVAAVRPLGASGLAVSPVMISRLAVISKIQTAHMPATIQRCEVSTRRRPASRANFSVMLSITRRITTGTTG